MIHLTRLRHGQQFLLNPDHIERVDTHVESVVRLTDGTEYVVVEGADEIVERIIGFRARILAVASRLHDDGHDHPPRPGTGPVDLPPLALDAATGDELAASAWAPHGGAPT